MKKVLTIAGSDCSGGAGIQADIKTITVHKMYAMSVITALTAQNTTGVYGVVDTPSEFVAKQMDCIFTDIKPDAVKIGMVSNPDIIGVIVDKLLEYQAKNIVVDPVMVSTSGSKLMSDEATSILMERLLPIGTVITPNLAEAAALCGYEIRNEEDMIHAAELIAKSISTGVLIKGGHLSERADDLLYVKGQMNWYRGVQVDNPNTHGTGCTLSSAIACNLADGYSLSESVGNAKAYITGALRAGLNLGQGRGPLMHTFHLE